MTADQFDHEGFTLDFRKVNAQPIEFYDDSLGDLVTQDVYQIARKGDLVKISLVKKSKLKGNEILRLKVSQKTLKDILYGLPKEILYGLSETRDEFKKELEIWNTENSDSKFFITDSNALPVYSRGNLVQQDETINSYVVGRLLPMCEDFSEEEFVGEKPFIIFCAKPESFVYVFDEEINLSVSFNRTQAISSLNNLYRAAVKVFCGRKSQEYQVYKALINMTKKKSPEDVSNLSYVVFDQDSDLKYSNLKEIEVEHMKDLMQAFPRIKSELKIDVFNAIIIGGNSNCYGMGYTNKGTIAVKNQLEHLLDIKQQFAEDSLPLNV